MSAFFDEIHARYHDADEFVRKLKSRMALHGITQGVVARRSGFHPTHISRWIGKRRSVKPTMETMVLLDETLERLIQGD